MLSRFVITPGALGETYSTSSVALELGVGCLNDLCRSEGLFADLRDGGWTKAVETVGPLAKRFLTFARKEHRLVSAPCQLPEAPEGEEEWLWEAKKFHDTFSCRALITSKALAVDYEGDPYVSIERLNLSHWWEARSPSQTVERNTAAYRDALDLVLRHANSLMFIDPYIDPLSQNYDEFLQLLLAAGANRQPPLIEIHRASWRKRGGQREVQTQAQWLADFNPWSEQLARSGLKVDVFLWEKMHDRFLITDLVGINVPYGFDIAKDAGETSTWTRLGPAQRDARQKEFDRACNRPAGWFGIGITED